MLIVWSWALSTERGFQSASDYAAAIMSSLKETFHFQIHVSLHMNGFWNAGADNRLITSWEQPHSFSDAEAEWLITSCANVNDISISIKTLPVGNSPDLYMHISRRLENVNVTGLWINLTLLNHTINQRCTQVELTIATSTVDVVLMQLLVRRLSSELSEQNISSHLISLFQPLRVCVDRS